MKKACPSCGASGEGFEPHLDAISGQRYEILRCSGCDLVFAEPFRFPGQDWYERFNYVDGYGEFGGSGGDQRARLLLSRLPIRSGTLLDVGCAAGMLLDYAASRGFQVEGLEVDRRFLELARSRAKGPVHEGVLDESFARKHEGRFDAVALLDVLEHLDDLGASVGRVRRLLKGGGYFLISVPDNRRPTVFGRDLWDYPPHHLSRWTPKALRTFLEREGFEVVDLRSGGLPTWEFSRVWADRSAAFLLRSLKKLLFGRGSAGTPMSDLIGGERESSLAAARLLPAKSLRLRLVSLYHRLFHAATFPFFFSMKLYYQMTIPGVGVNLLAVGRKKG
ncbi:MAG: class I SAM-dependent methyltransferase [Elusimicrobia bacterium]|nr:class I SAM-dependent methyltransferase [Elusimicrobiota bacterium]